jgi:hypothetical protein
MEWYKELFIETEEVDAYLISLEYLVIAANNFGIANNLFVYEKNPPLKKPSPHHEAFFLLHKIKEDYDDYKLDMAYNNVLNLSKNLGFNYLQLWSYVKADNTITHSISKSSVKINLEKNKIDLDEEAFNLIFLTLGRIIASTEIGTKGKKFSELSKKIINFNTTPKELKELIKSH